MWTDSVAAKDTAGFRLIIYVKSNNITIPGAQVSHQNFPQAGHHTVSAVFIKKPPHSIALISSSDAHSLKKLS